NANDKSSPNAHTVSRNLLILTLPLIAQFETVTSHFGRKNSLAMAIAGRGEEIVGWGFRTRLCSIYLCEEVMHSRPWLARLAVMPEVLPVQFMQMLCSNGVKLRLDFAVADQRYGNHKQRRANDPQPEEPTSPIHCSANPRPSAWIINLSSING